MSTMLSTMIVALVPIKSCKSRTSKWSGQIGSSHAFVLCPLLKPCSVSAEHASTAMLNPKEMVAIASSGRRVEERIMEDVKDWQRLREERPSQCRNGEVDNLYGNKAAVAKERPGCDEYNSTPLKRRQSRSRSDLHLTCTIILI